MGERLSGRDDILIILENQHENFVVLSKGERRKESSRLQGVVQELKERRVIGGNAS